MSLRKPPHALPSRMDPFKGKPNEAFRRRLYHQLARMKAEAAAGPCLLCDASATEAHVWVPDADGARALGIEPGARVYVYGTCHEHDPQRARLPEYAELVRQNIARALSAKL